MSLRLQKTILSYVCTYNAQGASVADNQIDRAVASFSSSELSGTSTRIIIWAEQAIDKPSCGAAQKTQEQKFFSLWYCCGIAVAELLPWLRIADPSGVVVVVDMSTAAARIAMILADVRSAWPWC